MPQYQGVWSLQQQMQALTSGQWATDPLFDYTTLLLQADNAANSAQNNTFLDSSTNSFAITRNGNTTQGTFSPFSLQPGAWSNYFDGSSAYLTIADNVAFEPGTGDFTIEAWVYDTVAAGTLNVYIAHTSSGVSFYRNASGKLEFAQDAVAALATSTNNIPVNSWNHIAVSRSGTSLKLFINGVQEASVTNSTNLAGTGSLGIGASSNGSNKTTGYISNLRLVKGTAVYTSAFTPSTIPLTAITNTSLLTCQSNRFVDNSTNAFTITANGTPSVQAFSPFAPQFQYTASGTGGSGYFDGTTDYLSIADNAALQFSATTVFTVEAWVYPTGVSAQQGIIVKRGSSGTQEWGLLISSSGNALFGGNSANLTGTTAIRANTWNHIAASSDGTTVSLYLNGAREGTATASSLGITSSTNAVLIGYQTTTVNPFTGWIASSRVVKGTQVYSGTTYTVPTAPLTAVTNTQLLLNFTNAGILDGTMKNNLETVGGASVSTSVVKYGSGSMYFDGTGDWAIAPANAMFNLGTSDFTIECWIYFTTTSSAQYFLGTFAVSPNRGWFAYFDTTLKLSFTYSTTGSNAVDAGFGYTPPTNTWVHIAFVRSGANLICYANGAQQGSTHNIGTSSIFANTQPLYIGERGSATGAAFNGYIDDLRITRFARYTQNFIPPSVALPRQ